MIISSSSPGVPLSLSTCIEISLCSTSFALLGVAIQGMCYNGTVIKRKRDGRSISNSQIKFVIWKALIKYLSGPTINLEAFKTSKLLIFLILDAFVSDRIHAKYTLPAHSTPGSIPSYAHFPNIDVHHPLLQLRSFNQMYSQFSL